MKLNLLRGVAFALGAAVVWMVMTNALPVMEALAGRPVPATAALYPEPPDLPGVPPPWWSRTIGQMDRETWQAAMLPDTDPCYLPPAPDPRPHPRPRARPAPIPFTVRRVESSTPGSTTPQCSCGDCRCDLCLCGMAPPEGSHEPAWSKALAKRLHGQAEYRTPDGSRVDVLTDETAWEVEWAAKWKEAPGQALLYGMATGRKPGVILLFKDREERLEYLRCLAVCSRAGITLRTVDTTK